MNWWERSEWLGFTAAVLANPDDNTARLVAADWLDERDDPTAAARAKLIRDQCSGYTRVLTMRPSQYAEVGLVESPYGRTVGLQVDRGWPSWAVFLPYQFTSAIVSPVFRLAPLTTCTTLGMNAEQSYDQDTTRTRPQSYDVFRFHAGPEWELNGEVDDVKDVANNRQLRRMVRAGRNAHAETYRQAGYIPAPIFYHLPGFGGNAAAIQRDQMNTRRDQYRSAIKAAYAVLTAAWRCGRSWAGLPLRVQRVKVNPSPYAALMVVEETRQRFRTDAVAADGGIVYPIPFPPAVSAESDVWGLYDDCRLLAEAGTAKIQDGVLLPNWPMRTATTPINFPDSIIHEPVIYGELFPMVTGPVTATCSRCRGVGFTHTKPKAAGRRSRRVRCRACNPLPE